MNRSFVLCLAAVLLAAMRAHPSTLSELAKRIPPPVELQYGGPGNSTQKMYMFPALDLPAGNRHPAIVWIHGGGWTGGEAAYMFPHARYFASRRMTAFSIEYRLARPGGPFIGDALADCRAAIAYIRARAGEWNIDPQRIAVAGDSAGAHLAASLGTEGLANAMLLYNGIYDLTVPDRTNLTGSVAASRKLSPLFAVHAGAAPAIVLHGLDDNVVPADQSQRFAAAMKASGNRCDLVLIEGARHAFVLPDYTAPEHQVVKAIRDGDAFLGSLGYVSGEPELETLAPVPAPRRD